MKNIDGIPITYKRIESVLAEHKPTAKAIHVLKTIGACMALECEIDL